MDDTTILTTIHGLVEEEHRLRQAAQAGEITSDEERARLRGLEQSLDQCWDLLRRRRAAIANRQHPDEVRERPVSQIEGYLQ